MRHRGAETVGLKPKPVTRSKSGARRKPRRITPFVIENYWPGNQRVAALRRHWPSHKPWWDVLDHINQFPAPKPVTPWQAKMMASYIRVRRPKDIGTFTAKAVQLGPETIRLRVRNRGPGKVKMFLYEPVLPEAEWKLRKTGRRKKPKVSKTAKLFAPGLSMTGPRKQKPRSLKVVRRVAMLGRNRRMRTLFRKGMTAKPLAKRFGLSTWRVYDICNGARPIKPR